MKWTDLNVVREVLIDSCSMLDEPKYSWFVDYLLTRLSQHGSGFVCLREFNGVRILEVQGGSSK